VGLRGGEREGEGEREKERVPSLWVESKEGEVEGVEELEESMRGLSVPPPPQR